MKMRTFLSILLLSVFSVKASVLFKQKILITNDDGWAVAQLRDEFKAFRTEVSWLVKVTIEIRRILTQMYQ